MGLNRAISTIALLELPGPTDYDKNRDSPYFFHFDDWLFLKSLVPERP